MNNRQTAFWLWRQLLLALTLSSVFFGTASVRAAFQMRSIERAGVTYVLLDDVARYYGMSLRHHHKSSYLSSQYSLLQLTQGKRQSELNNVTVHLSYAPLEWGRSALVSFTDFQLLIDPVLRNKGLPRRQVRKIVLDPGHGGRDHGAAGARFKEKDINLQIANRVMRILQHNGYQVHLTRGGDQYLSLDARTAYARRLGADLFVSLHANSVGTSSVSGIETFFLTPEGTPSTYSTAVDSKRTSVGNTFDRENARLAYEIQKHTIERTRARDRGIKHSAFAVLRNSSCPAVLIEMGFMSNPTEEGNLANSRYQNNLSAGIASGIAAFAEAVRP